MKNSFEYKLTVERGVFVADPFFALSDENYDSWYDVLNCDEGEFEFEGQDFCIAKITSPLDERVHAGFYCGYGLSGFSSDFVVTERSKALGVFPLVVPLLKPQIRTYVGQIILESGEFTFAGEDGHFKITTPSGKVLTIDTTEVEELSGYYFNVDFLIELDSYVPES